MGTQVRMPQMGLEVTEGSVMAVLVEVGAAVAEGDVLCEVETEKAISEVVAPEAGYVSVIAVAVGDSVPLGAVMFELVDSVDEVGQAGAADEGPEEPVDPPVGVDAPVEVGRERSAPGGESSGIKAAPVARRAAAKLGVDLATVVGTGPNGRIKLADVEAAAAAPSNGRPAPDVAETTERLTPTRQAIARRMTASQQIPQYQLTRRIDADWLLAQREQLRSDGSRVNVNDLLVQALAETAVRHPVLSANYVDTGPDGAPALRQRVGANVGVAVATDRGLLVPVVSDAHTRSLREIGEARAELVDRARAGRLGIDEMSGATITLSNLGSFGVDQFTAMVNPGESAILAVGRTGERLALDASGISVRQVLHLTMSFDHRVIDGATGGAALSTLAALLEGEMQWRA